MVLLLVVAFAQDAGLDVRLRGVLEGWLGLKHLLDVTCALGLLKLYPLHLRCLSGRSVGHKHVIPQRDSVIVDDSGCCQFVPHLSLDLAARSCQETDCFVLVLCSHILLFFELAGVLDQIRPNLEASVPLGL